MEWIALKLEKITQVMSAVLELKPGFGDVTRSNAIVAGGGLSRIHRVF